MIEDQSKPTDVNSPGSALPSGREGSVHTISPEELARVIVDIEHVIHEIEQFFVAQLSRLNDDVRQCQQAKKEGEVVQRLMVELEEQKQIWETERESELQRLRLASEKLSSGWDELETQRREALIEQDAMPTRSAPANHDGTRDSFHAFEQNNSYAPPDAESDESMAALMQIQQLQREIKNHTRRGS